MQPIGPLMIEHRLIERVVPLIQENGKPDPDFVVKIVDFFRTYADRCHHGKEEDLLFRALQTKPLSAEHKKILDELLAEHVMARESVGRLSRSKDPAEARTQLLILADLYPRHIEKEDKHFFIPVMAYFDQKQQAAMLEQMWEFDRKLIHEKYLKIMVDLEKTVK